MLKLHLLLLCDGLLRYYFCKTLQARGLQPYGMMISFNSA
jgi:hypothetical protein